MNCVPLSHLSNSSSLLLILFSISGHLPPYISYCILQYTHTHIHTHTHTHTHTVHASILNEHCITEAGYLKALYFTHLFGYGVSTLLILLLEGLKLDLSLVRCFAVVLSLLLKFGPQLVQYSLTLYLQSVRVLQVLCVQQLLYMHMSFDGGRNRRNYGHLILEFVHHALKLMLGFCFPLPVT